MRVSRAWLRWVVPDRGMQMAGVSCRAAVGFTVGAGEGAGALGLADAVPVPVDDRPVLAEFPGQGGVAGFPARIAAVTAPRVRAWEISRAWTGSPARRPSRAGAVLSGAQDADGEGFWVLRHNQAHERKRP